MRTLVRVTLPTEAANAAISNGKLKSLIEQTMARLKPEAAYFSPTNGMRSAMFVFDLKDASDIPSITEPWFSAVNAVVEFTPCMNLDDLTAGLQKVQSNG
jgi:hypothetical protein